MTDKELSKYAARIMDLTSLHEIIARCNRLVDSVRRDQVAATQATTECEKTGFQSSRGIPEPTNLLRPWAALQQFTDKACAAIMP